jgi:hypothetical protein
MFGASCLPPHVFNTCEACLRMSIQGCRWRKQADTIWRHWVVLVRRVTCIDFEGAILRVSCIVRAGKHPDGSYKILRENQMQHTFDIQTVGTTS